MQTRATKGDDPDLDSPDRLTVNTYDALGRMTQTQNTDYDDSANSGTLTRAYDPLDRVASEAQTGSGTPTTTFYYAAEGPDVIGEHTADTSQLRPEWRWLAEDPEGNNLVELRREVSGKDSVAWQLANRLGSSVASVEQATPGANPEPKATFTYDAYGNQTKAATTERKRAPYQFTGKRYDPISGTTHHQTRDYNPTLRTWTTTDQYLHPLQDLGLSADPLTRDRTLYAGGNPVNMIDEDGHRACSVGATTCQGAPGRPSVPAGCSGRGGGCGAIPASSYQYVDYTTCGCSEPGLGDSWEDLLWFVPAGMATKVIMKTAGLRTAARSIAATGTVAGIKVDQGVRGFVSRSGATGRANLFVYKNSSKWSNRRDIHHSFSFAVDKWVIRSGKIGVSRRNANGNRYIERWSRGRLNGKKGSYRIGYEIGEGRQRIITHRQFVEDVRLP